MYELKGEQFNLFFTDDNGDILLDERVKINYSYLILPILASFNTMGSTKFYVDAGSFLGYLVNVKYNYKNDDSSSFNNITDFYNRIDFGITLGMGLYIPVSEKILIDVGIKESLGLINIRKIDNSDFSEKTNSFGLKLGLKFKL